jgi:hypothetical protein
MIRGVPSSEKLFIEEDLNGRVGIARRGFERVHGDFGYEKQNQEGEEILNFTVAYDLIVANTFFRKKKIPFNYFQQWPNSSQIDFILTRSEERPNYMDYKVIPD